ncbi:hypothetical protein WICMUC_005228 [Wickerhamomyces mucosus]|uniref:Uncharacterized protein n=1 Tax=Wickerhamomyces mucosus TaxID=1378264 RepID=A0A9P8P919_9ASCO|nr:hypothetical protein WICMUC_005228 [Wickerhamomyces mucosus]
MIVDKTSEFDNDIIEDNIIEEILNKDEENDSKFKEFDDLDIDFKLERLQTLVKQSQVFSSIISDTLLESSLSKKRSRNEDNQQDTKSYPKRKSKRSKDKQQSIMDFYDKKGGEIDEETAKTKAKLNKPSSDSNVNNSTIKQPTLVTGIEMKDYQLEGTEWLITLYENGLNGILADEMGLGKTLQSIALLAFLYENSITGCFLIVTPLSTVGNWIKEFKKFTPKIPILGYIGTKDERKSLRDQYFPRNNNNNNIENKISVIITSYEIILRDLEFLGKIDWKFLIVDEGHRLKNINCKLIKELKKLKTNNRLLLTGTPLQNNLNELWSLLNFILPDIFHDLELFQKWFDFSSLTNLSKSSTNYKVQQLIEIKIQENLINNLHTILKPFLLRRLKKNVIKNLPPKREYIIYGHLTSIQSNLYKDALERSLKKSILKFALNEYIQCNNLKINQLEIDQFLLKFLDVEYLDSSTTDIEQSYLRSKNQVLNPIKISKNEEILQKIWQDINKWVENKPLQMLVMQLRLICGSPYLFYFPYDDENDLNLENLLKHSSKLQILNQLIPKLISQNHKVLIFSQFTKMLDLIQDWCELKGIEISRLDGSFQQSDREDQINRFNNDENVKIFLLSTRAGGLGLNLTKADSVIIFDNDWNPQVDLQAMDRVHRIGQTKPVIIYRFVLANTIEQVILAKADSKRKLEKLVIELGKFESLKKLIKKDNTLGFGNSNTNSNSREKSKQDNQLAKELTALFEDDRFKKDGLENVIDSKLTDDELNELLDRSPEAYNRDLKYYDKFQHIQIFETTAALD